MTTEIIKFAIMDESADQEAARLQIFVSEIGEIACHNALTAFQIACDVYEGQ